MVIFDDLHKLLLYQRLNLGFECVVCKRKFYNSYEHLEHTRNCKNENLACAKCGKTFSHQQILRLHMQFHNNLKESVGSQSNQECVEIIDSDDDEKQSLQVTQEADRGGTLESRLEYQVANNAQSPKSLKETEIQPENNLPLPVTILEPPKKRTSYKPKATPKTVKKKIGLTKVKFEDCLRCDDCSCIYIDKRDYYKHMRNFHQIDMNTNLPIPQQRTKRKCRSCCKQCRGGYCTTVKRPRATQLASNLIFKINMRDNIKNRWTKMVSQQLSECLMPPSESEQIEVKPDINSMDIKTEPVDTPDLSDILGQVEVKIKTEPLDY